MSDGPDDIWEEAGEGSYADIPGDMLHATLIEAVRINFDSPLIWELAPITDVRGGLGRDES